MAPWPMLGSAVYDAALRPSASSFARTTRV
jgi:hypothetical protein